MAVNRFQGLVGLGDIEDERLRRMLKDLSDWAERVEVHDSTAEQYVEVPVPLTNFIEENVRNAEEEVHGALHSLATAQALDSLNPINVTKGTGKIILVLNAGTDVTGTITITGNTVHRDTGVVTAGDTDTITVDALTTDNSDTDAEGNARHAFTGAYITSKWFTDACVISTTDLTLTDVDVWHCSFEQFNDYPELTLRTFDINCYTTNANAWIYAYLYLVDVQGSGPKVNVERVASLNIDDGDAIANEYWRLRRGASAIDREIDGRKDGIWVDLYMGPAASTYFQDFTMKVWATMKVAVQGG